MKDLIKLEVWSFQKMLLHFKVWDETKFLLIANTFKDLRKKCMQLGRVEYYKFELILSY